VKLRRDRWPFLRPRGDYSSARGACNISPCTLGIGSLKESRNCQRTISEFFIVARSPLSLEDLSPRRATRFASHPTLLVSATAFGFFSIYREYIRDRQPRPTWSVAAPRPQYSNRGTFFVSARKTSCRGLSLDDFCHNEICPVTPEIRIIRGRPPNLQDVG